MWLISTFFCLFYKSFPLLVYGSRFETYRTEADYSPPSPPSILQSGLIFFFSSTWSMFRAPSRGGRFSSVKSNLFLRRCSRYIPRISSSPLSPPPSYRLCPAGLGVPSNYMGGETGRSARKRGKTVSKLESTDAFPRCRERIVGI